MKSNVDSLSNDVQSLLIAGKTIAEIKTSHPMASSSFICKLRKDLNLPRRPLKTVFQDEEVFRLHQRGFSALEIAEKLQQKESVVYKSLRRQGLKPTRKTRPRDLTKKHRAKPGPKPKIHNGKSVSLRLPKEVIHFLRWKGPTVSMAALEIVKSSPEFSAWIAMENKND